MGAAGYDCLYLKKASELNADGSGLFVRKSRFAIELQQSGRILNHTQVCV